MLNKVKKWLSCFKWNQWISATCNEQSMKHWHAQSQKLNYWYKSSEYLNHILTITKYCHSNRFEFWRLILHQWQLMLLLKIQMLAGDKKLAILCLKDVNLLIRYIFWIFFPIILYPDFLYRFLQKLIGIETRQTNKSKYAPIYSMHMAILSNSFFSWKLIAKKI